MAAPPNRPRMLESRELSEESILAALMGITEMMGDLTDLEELLDAIVRIAPRLVSVDRCAIFLRNPRAREFRVAHAFTADEAVMVRLMRLALAEADVAKLAHKLVDQRVPVMLRQWREPLLPAPVADAFDVRSMLLVPLVYQEQVLGFITLDEAGRDHLFTSREVNVVQAIAAHAAVAIVHTRLAEAFRLERRRSEALAGCASDGVITLDRTLRVVSLSGGAEALLGWSTDDAAGRPAAELFDDPAGTRNVLAPARKVLGGAPRETAAVRFRTNAGTDLACWVTAVAVPGTMGGPAEVLYAITNAEGGEPPLTTRRSARTGAG